MKKELTDKQKAKMKQIVDAAVSCFANKGFHATSTAEICKAAGMSPGNVFHYFSSKMQIIEAIAIEDGLIYQAIFNEQLDTDNVIDSIVGIVKALVAYINSDPECARISMEVGTEASRNPEVMKIFLANEEISKAKLSQLIAHGIQKGEIDNTLQPEATASWILMLSDGTLGRSIMEPSFDWSSHHVILEKMIRKALAPI